MTESCAERVQENLTGRLEDLTLLWAGICREECPKCSGSGEIKADSDDDPMECEYCDGTGKLGEDIKDLGSLYDYGLAFDYVAPHTFDDQPRGYFRYQLSWGGPGDEFHIFADGREYHWNVDKIEYWFMDWYDGAKKILSGDDYKLISDIFHSMLVDTGTAESVYAEAMQDYDPYEHDENESDEED